MTRKIIGAKCECGTDLQCSTDPQSDVWNLGICSNCGKKYGVTRLLKMGGRIV